MSNDVVDLRNFYAQPLGVAARRFVGRGIRARFADMRGASVLGVAPAEIGRTDHFFDRGGDSLTAVRVAVTLQRAVSLKDITRHPVLADLAALVDGRADNREERR